MIHISLQNIPPLPVMPAATQQSGVRVHQRHTWSISFWASPNLLWVLLTACGWQVGQWVMEREMCVWLTREVMCPWGASSGSSSLERNDHWPPFISPANLHLGEDVAHNSSSLVLSDVRQLWPRERVVEVVFHLVVLWQTQQVAVLHVQQVLRLHKAGEIER